MKQKTDAMSSIEKAMMILMAFTPHNHETGTLELSKKLGINKSTVSRLLHTLTAQGFLEQNPSTRKYVLGPSAAEIGNAVNNPLGTNIVGIAQPYLGRLCEELGESVALEVLSGNKIFLAHHEEGRHHIRFVFNPGEQVPMHVAAGAKAILAYSDPSLVEECLKRKFIRFTSKTITIEEQFLTELAEVRKTGIAFDRGERFENACAMAAPIFNHDKNAIAAVVMAGPIFRMTPSFLKKSTKPLLGTAKEISRRLCC